MLRCITLHAYAIRYVDTWIHPTIQQLHYVELHYTALHCIALYYIALGTLHLLRWISLSVHTLHYTTLSRGPGGG